MKFETVDDPGHPIRLTLENDPDECKLDEVDVVRAAYREAIYLRAQKGNAGSISDFDRYIATAAEDTDDEDLVLSLISKDGIAEVLEEFADRTDDAIVEIPGQSYIPPYESDYIVERYRMGQMATKLAQEIREAEAALPKTDEEISAAVDQLMTDIGKHTQAD